MPARLESKVEPAVSNPSPDESPIPPPNGSARLPLEGMSPYATGGGDVTFERKRAVYYLAHLLVGDGVFEFGDGRRLESVAFQQTPTEPVDDLVLQVIQQNASSRPSYSLPSASAPIPS